MYKLNFLDPNDQDRVQNTLAFVKKNAGNGIRLRPEAVMNQAIATGEVLLLWRDGELAGASFVYEFHERPGDLDSFLEIGTMTIPNERDNGFRGQQVFSLLHLLNLDYMNDGSLPKVFAVVEDNTASHHIMTKHVGMVQKTAIPKKLAELRANSGTPFNPKKLTVWADDDVILKNLKTLKGLIIEDNLILSPKGEKEISIDVHPVTHETLDMLIKKRDLRC